MIGVAQIREVVASARASGDTHVRLVVERFKPIDGRSVVRLNGRSGPAADPERAVIPIDDVSVAAWFHVGTLRRWLERQRVSADAI